MLKERKKQKVRYITDKEGNKKEVILSINDYNQLLEDIEDLVIAAAREKDILIDHDKVLEQLRKDGLL
ncbi:hypothetical protein ASZ90_004782 [hydrocarbon metagenome]|uniref:Uncharacterized protein n=1 Tax=hydrocarbon metagenome TaxID=938273 RepID=A0A0W8FXF4_9ZZZZ